VYEGGSNNESIVE